VFGLFRNWRRKRLLRTPFSAEWLAIVERNVPLYRRLPPAQQESVQNSTRILLAEKNFEGCGGLVMTDEIRVTIAAHAALLLLGRSRDFFPNLNSILVYPSAYRGPVTKRLASGIVEEGVQGRLGESWDSGIVVLSWDDTLHGADDPRDGHNVVLHEFAHQLDQEDGAADGTPYLGGRSVYAAWGRVLGADFERLRKGRGVLDRYGATNPAEFFAVATETFFEKPQQLRAKNGELYDQLRAYYGVDPAEDSTR
jgi:Mlc titration factor MtfA (ptsG expression regulator)